MGNKVQTLASWVLIGTTLIIIFFGLSSFLTHMANQRVQAENEFGQSYETQIKPVENEQG